MYTCAHRPKYNFYSQFGDGQKNFTGNGGSKIECKINQIISYNKTIRKGWRKAQMNNKNVVKGKILVFSNTVDVWKKFFSSNNCLVQSFMTFSRKTLPMYSEKHGAQQL